MRPEPPSLTEGRQEGRHSAHLEAARGGPSTRRWTTVDPSPPTTSMSRGVAAQGSTGIRSGPRRSRYRAAMITLTGDPPGSGRRRRPPRGLSRIGRQRPSELDGQPLPARVRLRALRLPVRPGAVAPSAPWVTAYFDRRVDEMGLRHGREPLGGRATLRLGRPRRTGPARRKLYPSGRKSCGIRWRRRGGAALRRERGPGGQAAPLHVHAGRCRRRSRTRERCPSRARGRATARAPRSACRWAAQTAWEKLQRRPEPAPQADGASPTLLRVRRPTDGSALRASAGGGGGPSVRSPCRRSWRARCRDRRRCRGTRGR